MGWYAAVVGLLGLATVGFAVAHALRPSLSSLAASVALVGITFVGGLAATVLGLIHSFAGVASVDPSMKATLLAKGISESMNATAVSLLTIPMWLLPFIVGEVRRARLRAR